MSIYRRLGQPALGIARDLRSRLPMYASDWKDSWNYRVIPATVYLYFTNLLPALAFAQDMFTRTENSYGVNEVLLSSALAGIIFGVLGGQTLCIVGVTGPISIFNYTVYDIVKPRGTPYFPFMAWICLWSMVMHIIIALFNWVSVFRRVTEFSCDIFGAFICIIYIEKGVQILVEQFHNPPAHTPMTAADLSTAGYLSVVLALLTAISGVLFGVLSKHSTLFWPWVRKIFDDYGTPVCVCFFTGFYYFPGIHSSPLRRLEQANSFEPTTTLGGRSHGWFIHFWNIDVNDVFLAIPFAILLTLLFYFDQNVSSMICQGTQYPLKKPAAFHYDFLLLGVTTGLSGLLGIPAPNGLIPQAPLHTASLCVFKQRDTAPADTVDDHLGVQATSGVRTFCTGVIEQRFTNTAQGVLTLITMTRPLLVVLGLIPQAVLAGLFWIMGISGLMGNAIVNRLGHIMSDKSHMHPMSVLRKVRRRSLYVFLALELLGVGAEVAITQTVAAVGFPAVLLATVIVGCYIPKFIGQEDASVLDKPTCPPHIVKSLVIHDGKNVAREEKSALVRTRTTESLKSQSHTKGVV